MSSFTPQQIEDFLQEFFDVVGARQYVGARYVPIFGRAGEDTVEWDDGAPYEPLTVVMHEGVSYVSRRYVPTGIQITNTNYWVETYRFNAQVEQYRQEVLGFQDQIDEIREDYVPFPDELTLPKYGTLGQVLTTLANGATKWEEPVTVDADIAEPLIEAWLDDHPEATTTVQDGAITLPKLATALLNSILSGTNDLVRPTNYANLLPNADYQPNNSILCIQNSITSEMTQNLPVYGKVGILAKLSYNNTNMQGCAQLYVCREPGTADTVRTRVYARMSYGGSETPTYGAWVCLNPYDVESYVRGIGATFLVHSNDYQTRLPDADYQPNNTIFCVTSGITSEMTQNLPMYGTAAMLVRLAYAPDKPNGTMQLYVGRPSSTADAEIFMRASYGTSDETPAFSPWTHVNTLAHESVMRGTGASNLVQYYNYLTLLPDADYQPNNTIFCVTTSITSEMTQHLPVYSHGGILVRFAYSPDAPNGTAQLYFTRDSAAGDTTVWVRMSYGSADTPVFSPWTKANGVTDAVTNDRLSHRTCSIFRKVVCCGDSYTSGWIDRVTENEDYAWPHYMEVITGGQYINCGDSHETSLSWQTAPRGLPKAQQAGVAQAYIIGLMINDVELGVPLGTQADIGTQAQTYYGGLSQVVEALNTISPQAKIFIQTCPRTTDTYQPYNQAVRDVVTHYAQTMNTHLLDLYAYLPLYTRASITGDAYLSHYTAIGYQQFAENLAYVMSDYINTHITAFRDVYSLPTS